METRPDFDFLETRPHFCVWKIVTIQLNMLIYFKKILD